MTHLPGRAPPLNRSFTMPTSKTRSNACSRCNYSTADRRRCTSLVYSGHVSLCHQHLRQQLDAVPPSEDIATEILSSIQNLQSAATINAALGKILALLAAGRIKRQDAIAMTYVCQLLMQSLKGFKREIN
jgi:hypothetical protein